MRQLNNELNDTFGKTNKEYVQLKTFPNTIINYEYENNKYYDIIHEPDNISFFCPNNNIIYHTLLKEGLLNKYYPDWFKFGRY
uniref:Uncharacterized protein n=1 Tax=viral metagenome TaxID=1070528 RepID=A0A6C0H5T7_9ZZZZ